MTKKKIRGGRVQHNPVQRTDPSLVDPNDADGESRVYTRNNAPIQLIPQDELWLGHSTRIIPTDTIEVINATTQLLTFLEHIQQCSNAQIQAEIDGGLNNPQWIQGINYIYGNLRYYLGHMTTALINSIPALSIRSMLIDNLLLNRRTHQKLTALFGSLNLQPYRSFSI